jgi:signal transduction histidine kinase
MKEAKELMQDSLYEVNRLEKLSSSLLELAQYEKPNENIKFSPLHLSKVVTLAVKKVKPIADQKDIKIKTSVKDAKITGSEYSLTDLFVILLENAVKYSPKNKTVSIEAKRTDSCVIVSVKDEGPGIPKKDIPHIFDRFFRSDASRSQKNTNGFGLGLSIAQKIVESHRGTITVQSKVGSGTTFKVKLPAKSFS